MPVRVPGDLACELRLEFLGRLPRELLHPVPVDPGHLSQGDDQCVRRRLNGLDGFVLLDRALREDLLPPNLLTRAPLRCLLRISFDRR